MIKMVNIETINDNKIIEIYIKTMDSNGIVYQIGRVSMISILFVGINMIYNKFIWISDEK